MSTTGVSAIPPQPQVFFTVLKGGVEHEGVGRLYQDDEGHLYAVRLTPVARYWALKLDRSNLEWRSQRIPYLVHVKPIVRS